MSVPGSNIRLLREQMGLSLRALANATDVDVATLSRLERGMGGYSREALERIARELNVSLGVLFAEPSAVEAAALRMRRVPILTPEQLLHWKGPDDFPEEDPQPVLHLGLDRGSRYLFAVRAETAANAPEIRPDDVLIFDAEKTPTRPNFVIAQDEKMDIVIGRFRLLGPKHGVPQFEVVPLDMAFMIVSTTTTPSLRLRGQLIELRRPFPR